MIDSLLEHLVSISKYILCPVVVVFSFEASAEVIDLAPFEVTGSRIQNTYSSNTDIRIGVEELNASNPVGLWDVFNFISGVQVEHSAGLGGNAAIYVRGGEPNSAKVLIDGMDVGNIMDIRGGSYNFNGVGLNTIEQVKFIAGSRSAIYGSDALSGVISISTIPTDWMTQSSMGEAVLQIGQGGLLEAGVSQAVKLEKTYIRAGTSYTREDSWSEGSEFEARRANIGVASRMNETTTLQFSGFGAWLDRSHLPDDSGGPLYAVWKETDLRETEQYGVSLKAVTSLLPDSSLNTHAYYYRFDEFVDSPGVAPGERDPFGVPTNLVGNLLERFQVSSYLLHDPHPDLSFAYGISLLDEKGDSQSTVVYPFATIDGQYSQSVGTLSAFMEAGWQVQDSIRLKGALRYDDIEDLDQVWTGRLESIISLPASNSELSVAWGSGFKKPTFFALSNPVIGNPDLLPEESDQYELTLLTRFPNQNMIVTNAIFRQEYNNLIDFSESPPPRMVNLNEVVSQGISSQVSMDVGSDTRIAADLTYVDMEVVDSDELLRNRPKWKAALSLRHQLIDNLDFFLHGMYISSRLDSSIPTGTRELDSYFRLDTGLNWKINDNLRISLLVDNLLDEKYEELIGFMSPGVRLRSKLRLLW